MNTRASRLSGEDVAQTLLIASSSKKGVLESWDLLGNDSMVIGTFLILHIFSYLYFYFYWSIYKHTFLLGAVFREFIPLNVYLEHIINIFSYFIIFYCILIIFKSKEV